MAEQTLTVPASAIEEAVAAFETLARCVSLDVDCDDNDLSQFAEGAALVLFKRAFGRGWLVEEEADDSPMDPVYAKCARRGQEAAPELLWQDLSGLMVNRRAATMGGDDLDRFLVAAVPAARTERRAMMPAEQRGSVYKTSTGYGLRWYDETGARRRQAGFSSRSEARRWFENVERPRMRGEAVARPPVTLREHVDRWLVQLDAVREPATVETLRVRLGATSVGEGQAAPIRLRHPARRVRRRESLRPRAPLARDRPVGRRPAGWLSLPGCGGAATGARGGRPVEGPRGKPGEAGRPEPAAEARGDPPVHAGGG